MKNLKILQRNLQVIYTGVKAGCFYTATCCLLKERATFLYKILISICWIDPPLKGPFETNLLKGCKKCFTFANYGF